MPAKSAERRRPAQPGCSLDIPWRVFDAPLLLRAWSLLITTYQEVSAAGRWLFRHENGEARFPSLYTIGRQRRSRRPGDSDEGDAIPGDGIPADDVIAEPAIPQT